MSCFKLDDSWKLQTPKNYTFDDLDVHDYLDMSVKGAYFISFLITLKSFLKYSVDVSILVLTIIDFPSLMALLTLLLIFYRAL
jgi:hypothetical protein